MQQASQAEAFQQHKQKYFDVIAKNSTMILSTACNNHVTSRKMSYIYQDGHILFQTDLNSRKYKQMTANENVAVSIANLQIEGEACLLGHPFDTENSVFLADYKVKHKMPYKLYSKLDCERVVQIRPATIISWDYLPNGVYSNILSLNSEQLLCEKMY